MLLPVAGVEGGGEEGGGREGRRVRTAEEKSWCILPAFCWDGERPVSDGQRSVPRGKAENAAAGMEGDTGDGAADSLPQRTAHQWQGVQILHCCRSLPPPPPQRTSEAKKQSFRRSYSQARTKEYHLGWLSPGNTHNSQSSDHSLCRHNTVQTQACRLPGINYMEIKVIYADNISSSRKARAVNLLPNLLALN